MENSLNMGGCIVSRNILENKAKLKWCFREEGINELDNGWRFLSEKDTDDYLKDISNLLVCDWGTIFELEPAIALIYGMPIGTELTLIYEEGNKYFVYTETGEKCIFS